MKKKTYIVFIVAAVLAVAMGAAAFLEAKLPGIGFFEERVHQLSVESQKDLEEKQSSLYNDVIRLENDITLKDKSLLFCSPEQPFVGTFDGRGYKVTLQGDFSESIFGNIGEGGVVENVEIVLSADNRSTMQESYCALLALENRGVIRNCKISVEMVEAKGAIVCGMVVAKNIGTISNVYVDAVVHNAGLDPSLACIGAIAGKMQGRNSVIKNCVVHIDYTGVTDEYKGDFRDRLKLVVGQSITGTVENCMIFIPESLNYLDLTGYTESTFPTILGEGDQVSFDVAALMETYQFSEELWIIEQNRLMLLPEDER